MEVSLEKIKANPFRNLKLFPLDQAKIDKLKSSINRTEFWDNVVARAKGEHFELAYGHHRIEAVKQVKGKMAVVNLIVRDLDDPMMLKMMSADNDDIYRVTPNFYLEAVQAAKSIISKQKSTGTGPRGKDSWLQTRIAKLLDWPVERVKTALAELGMIERKELAHDAIKQLSNMKQAKAFHQIVNKAKIYGIPISHTRQVTLAKEIAETTGSYAEKSVKDTLLNDVHPLTYKPKNPNLTKLIVDTAMAADKLIGKLDMVVTYRDDLISDIYRDTREAMHLRLSLGGVIERINNLIKGTHEKNTERKKLDIKINRPRQATKPNGG